MTFQFFAFVAVFAALICLTCYVRINLGVGGFESDRIIRAFLAFIGTSMVWTVLSFASALAPATAVGLFIKLLSLFALTSIPVFFLAFAQRLAGSEPGVPVFFSALINLCLTVIRCLMPFDFERLAFWRTRNPVIAPLLAASITLPLCIGVLMLAKSCAREKSNNRKNQLLTIALGASLSTLCVLVSEYLLPTVFGADVGLSLIYVAVLVFVGFSYRAIRKLGLMLPRPDYVFRNLFMNAHKAAVVTDSDGRILSANSEARLLLGVDELEPGERLENYIPGFHSDELFNFREATVNAGGKESYLLISLFPIEARKHGSEKVIILTDITDMKLKIMRENSLLLSKTYIDRLTGLYNRYYITETDSPFYAAGPGDGPLALLFIDVDNFKTINDRYGHFAGDELLCELADCIREYTPESACAVRFGGDEFVVVLPGAGAVEATEIAERIRSRALMLDFSHIGDDVAMSLSIGLVCGSPPLVDLIDRADRAMYTSKRRGKNTVTTA